MGGELLPTFHPSLSWTHYRALIRVSYADARSFYEVEAVGANWSSRDLERQINSLYYTATAPTQLEDTIIKGRRRFHAAG